MAKIIKIPPKDIIVPRAIVLDKEHKEIYEEVDRKTAEKFGRDSLAYRTITNGIDLENVTGSQFFWNTNLNLYLPINMRVTQLSDWEDINDIDKDFFSGFYTDSPQIVLRTKTPSWDKDKYILEYLVEQVSDFSDFDFSPENPLLITNAELIKDDNPDNKYGLLLGIGPDTWFRNDERFAYSNNGKEISFGKGKKRIYTREHGLSRVCLDGGGGLDSRSGSLSGSGVGGRVVVKDVEKCSEAYTPEQISATLKKTNLSGIEEILFENLRK